MIAGFRVTDCANVRTIASDGRLSTFCVESPDVIAVLRILVPALEQDYLDQCIIEVVEQYGKGSIGPDDSTTSVVTINVPSHRLEIHEISKSPELATELCRLAKSSSRFDFILNGARLEP